MSRYLTKNLSVSNEFPPLFERKRGGKSQKPCRFIILRDVCQNHGVYDTMEHLVRHRTVTPSPNNRGRLRVIEGSDPYQ